MSYLLYPRSSGIINGRNKIRCVCVCLMKTRCVFLSNACASWLSTLYILDKSFSSLLSAKQNQCCILNKPKRITLLWFEFGRKKAMLCPLCSANRLIFFWPAFHCDHILILLPWAALWLKVYLENCSSSIPCQLVLYVELDKLNIKRLVTRGKRDATF